MTDNILYLDEQGYPCDDYRDIHEAIDKTTKNASLHDKGGAHRVVS